jgi:4-alpha-glucanotransferase
LAFGRFLKIGDFDDFMEFASANCEWLDDYAMFMAIKDYMPEGNWVGWRENLKTRQPEALDIFEAAT